MTLIWTTIALLMAWRDSRTLKDKKQVSHTLNGSIHAALFITTLLVGGWKTAIASLMIAHIVFDISLNLLRGLSWNYQNPNPNPATQAVTDKVTAVLGFVPTKIIALVVAVVLLVSCTNYPQQKPESLSNDMKAAQYEKTVEIIQAAGDISRGMVQDSIEKGR